MQKPARTYGMTKVQYANLVREYEASQVVAAAPGEGFFSRLVKRFR
jgi:hypothetical protein